MSDARPAPLRATSAHPPVVVIDRWPLPAVSGSRQRLWHLVHAIDRLGPADLVVLADVDGAAAELLTAALPGWTLHVCPVPKRARRIRSRLRWLVRGDVPTALAVMDTAHAVRLVRERCAGAPRLIVAFRPLAASVAVAAARSGDVVAVDFEDIESVKLRRLRAIDPPGRNVASWVALRQRVDESAWRRFEQSVREATELVTVCSRPDRTALGGGDVVPNGTTMPTSMFPAVRRSAVPTMLYVGQLTYTPNVLAARRLACEILPLVRRQMPTARLELIGNAGRDVGELERIDGVTVRGFVADLEASLRAAHVLVVPLTVGSGTRLKILEAFAHRLPVVSTSVGVEGIDVTHDHQLLVADSNEELGRAIIDVFSDPAAAAVRADRAHRFVARSMTWERIESAYAERLRRIAPRSVHVE